MTTTAEVCDYWQTHPLGMQYVRDASVAVGSREFFEHIRPWMTPYKFPEVMPRIDREAARLRGKHLLEIGCGMGFDSLEFLKRGVRVTAIDLTPAAVELARRHFEIMGLMAEEVRVDNALRLSYPNESFDAVYSIGVLHHTGDTQRAVREIFRVLKPGGRAIICHLYRRPSWLRMVSTLGRENIEFTDEDAPVIDFFTDSEVIQMFEGFEIDEVIREHYRALPIARTGLIADLYRYGFRPAFNLLPESVAQKVAHKISIIANKPKARHLG